MFFGGLKTKIFLKIQKDVATTTEEHYIIWITITNEYWKNVLEERAVGEKMC